MTADRSAAGDGRQRALGVLGRSAPFRRLWAARFISYLGDSLGLVALILYVAERAGTGVAVGLLLLAGDLTPTLVSPLTGALADRVDQRRLMVACELAQAILVGAIALFLPPLPVLLALVAARSVLFSAFQPAARSAVPELVDDADLEAANALLGFGTHGLEVGGPLLAALLLPLAGVRGVLALDAITFLVAVPLLLGLPRLPPAPRDPLAGAGLFADAWAGLRYIWRRPVIRALTVGFSGAVVFTAVDDIALVFLARDTLGASGSAASALYAGPGLGLVLGFALLARWGRRGHPAMLFLCGFAVSSAGNLLTGLAPTVAAAFAIQAVRGLGISLIEVGHNTLLQRWVPRAMRARVFANLYGAIGLAAGLSYVLGGPFLDLTSPRVALVVAGAGGLLATAATALMLLPALARQPQDAAPDDAA